MIGGRKVSPQTRDLCDSFRVPGEGRVSASGTNARLYAPFSGLRVKARIVSSPPPCLRAERGVPSCKFVPPSSFWTHAPLVRFEYPTPVSASREGISVRELPPTFLR